MKRSLWVKIACVIILAADVLLQPFLISSFGPEDIAYYRDTGTNVEVLGEVVNEPDVRADGQNLVVKTDALTFLDVTRGVRGKVMVKAPRYPGFSYGDFLRVSCRLQAPPVFEEFSYAAFLAKDDIFVLCSRPVIWKQPDTAGSGSFGRDWSDGVDDARRAFWKTVFTFKGAMTARINELFTEPGAALVAGILVGQRRSIPQEIIGDFNATGLTHILAVSGYNVSMMITVFGYLFKGAARRRRFAGMFGGVLALVAFTGFSSSVLRAAWMGCITLLALAAGRKGSGVHLLLVSAVVMVLLSPRMILVDMSFQLSFLSTLGILVFMPKIEEFERNLTARPGFAWIVKIPAFVREGFCVTMAAQVFTIPLIIHQFGRFSLIAPVANIFVLPFIPWIMLFGFCALAVSFFFFPLGQFCGFIAHVLLSVVLLLVEVFAGIPFASLEV
jgi:competence protein ComEC